MEILLIQNFTLSQPVTRVLYGPKKEKGEKKEGFFLLPLVPAFSVCLSDSFQFIPGQ